MPPPTAKVVVIVEMTRPVKTGETEMSTTDGASRLEIVWDPVWLKDVDMTCYDNEWRR